MSAADHDRGFFEQMATCRDAYRRLADAIHATLGPHSVLDVGAGLGFVPARLAELGWDATACDPYAPRDMRDTGCAWWADLALDGRWVVSPLVDVVICTETAEHIELHAAETIVRNLVDASRRWIVWSAAQPGQEWPGHVNLRPTEYWAGLFFDHGFAQVYGKTEKLREEMRARHAQHEHAGDNFMVFARLPPAPRRVYGTLDTERITVTGSGAGEAP